jgi:hypothetical protein
MSDYDEGDQRIDWEDDDDDVQVEAPGEVSRPQPIAFPRQEELSTAVESVSALDTSNDIISIAATGEGEQMTVIQIDAHGNEVSTVVDLALPPLEEEEAREITERIKSTTNILYLLIKRAHAGKAWKALGYSSFEAYVREEFSYSRSYAYKLLNQANVIEAIEAVAPVGTEVYVGELTARGLKKSLPELVDAIEDRTADASPEEAREIIEDIISEVKENKNRDDNFDEDFDEDFNPGEFGGGNNSSSAFDYIDDEDDSLDEFLGGDDPSIVVHKLENLYTLLTSLQNFKELDEKDNLSELLPLIPSERRSEVSSLIDINSQWLEKLKTGWNDFLENNPDDSSNESNDEDFGSEEEND